MKGKLSKIEMRKKQWEDGTLKNYLEKFPEREIVSELPAKRLYTLLDRGDSDYLKDLGFPGEYPYTRGTTPTMYRSDLWPIWEYVGFGSPEDTARLCEYIVEKGIGWLWIAPDLPSQIGLDADDPLAEPEVGLVGVSISSLKDVENMFEGIPMNKVGIGGSINHPGLIFWMMYVAAAEKMGISSDKLQGVTTIDCLQEFVGRGSYIFPPEGAVRLQLDLVEYGIKHIPNLLYLINSYTLREQGGTGVQEAAYSILAGLFFLEEARKRGMLIDDLGPRMIYHPGCDIHLFEEAARCRAMRRLYAKLVKERFNPKNPDALQHNLWPTTRGSLLTAQQAENNIVRVTLALLGGLLGGVNTTSASSFDEALGIPTRRAATIAIRTQQILAHESGIADVIDPLGGSYYVEALTDEFEKKILDYINQIESKGGLLKVIESGWLRRELARSAYVRQKEIDEGKQIIVGLNKFFSEERPTFTIHKADPQVVEKRKGELEKLRRERDSGAVRRSLKKVREAAQGNANLAPFLMDGVKNYATLGEIIGVLKEVLGEYRAVGF